MKYLVPIVVWLFMVVTSLGEVAVFYMGPGTFNVDATIAGLAVVNGVVAALFSMNLRKEPEAIQQLFLAPVFLIAVLIITMIFAFSH